MEIELKNLRRLPYLEALKRILKIFVEKQNTTYARYNAQEIKGR